MTTENDQTRSGAVDVTPGDAMLFADEAFRDMDVELGLDDIEDIRGALQSVINRLAATPSPDAQLAAKIDTLRAARDALAGRHIITCPFKSRTVEKSPCPVCGLNPYGAVCVVNDLEVG